MLILNSDICELDQTRLEWNRSLSTIREGHQKKRIAFWTFNKYISVTLVLLLNVFSNCQPEITLVAFLWVELVRVEIIFTKEPSLCYIADLKPTRQYYACNKCYDSERRVSNMNLYSICAI